MGSIAIDERGIRGRVWRVMRRVVLVGHEPAPAEGCDGERTRKAASNGQWRGIQHHTVRAAHTRGESRDDLAVEAALVTRDEKDIAQRGRVNWAKPRHDEERRGIDARAILPQPLADYPGCVAPGWQDTASRSTRSPECRDRSCCCPPRVRWADPWDCRFDRAAES